MERCLKAYPLNPQHFPSQGLARKLCEAVRRMRREANGPEKNGVLLTAKGYLPLAIDSLNRKILSLVF